MFQLSHSTCSCFGIFFLCACADTALFVLPAWNLLPPSFSAISIGCKRVEIFGNCDNVVVDFWPSISERPVQILTSGWIQRPRFTISVGYFGNQSTFSVYLALRCQKISIWPRNLKTGHLSPCQTRYCPSNLKVILTSVTEWCRFYNR